MNLKRLLVENVEAIAVGVGDHVDELSGDCVEAALLVQVLDVDEESSRRGDVHGVALDVDVEDDGAVDRGQGNRRTPSLGSQRESRLAPAFSI